MVVVWISSHPLLIYWTIHKITFPLEHRTHTVFLNVLHVLSCITRIVRGLKDSNFKYLLIHRFCYVHRFYYTWKVLGWKIISWITKDFQFQINCILHKSFEICDLWILVRKHHNFRSCIFSSRENRVAYAQTHWGCNDYKYSPPV